MVARGKIATIGKCLVVIALVVGGFEIGNGRVVGGAFAAELSEPNVFEKPRIRIAQATIAALLQAGRNKEADQALDQLLAGHPQLAEAQFFKAVAVARLGTPQEALGPLEASVANGFKSTAAIRTEASFSAIRNNPRFAEILAKASANATSQKPAQNTHVTKPAAVRDGRALVSESNTDLDARTNLLRSRFKFNSKLFAPRKAYVGPEKTVQRLLNDLMRGGRAAGNLGDLYDNRDRDHSVMGLNRFPQMTRIEYSPEAKKAGADFSFNTSIFFDAPTIGNASLGVSGAFSMARSAMDIPRNLSILYLQYRSGQLYVYPSVNDYNDGGVDVFPANIPYLLVSRGKSTSDRVFLDAAAFILAAFKPVVKEYLIKEKLLIPTVQMVFRRSQKNLNSPQDYLTALAHPTVYSSENLDYLKMVQLANALEIESIPPVVQLSVLEESTNAPPAQAKNNQELRGVQFNTPSAIARAVIKQDGTKRMVISAAGTRHGSPGPIKLHWVVLEGDAGRVEISPRNDIGTVAEIVVPWHGRRPSRATPGMQTDRIDIGVFAERAGQFSAPSFISVYNVPEDRSYPNWTKK